MAEDEKQSYKKFLTFLIGAFFTVFGITLILVFFSDVASFFRGIGGMVFALIGLLILYSLSK